MMQHYASGIHTAQTRLPEDDRKPYTKPAILHELELETRAGSGVCDPSPCPLDPLQLPGG